MVTIAVEGVFAIRGRGTVVDGTVVAGKLPPSGAIGWAQQPDRPPLRAQISGYEMPNPGRLPSIGVLIRGIDRDDLEVGRELAFALIPERQEEIQASVRLPMPAEDERRSPLKLGDRHFLRVSAGLLGHNGDELSHRCTHALATDERMWPGDERVLTLKIQCIPELSAKLNPGLVFTPTQWPVIAQGTVLEVRRSVE